MTRILISLSAFVFISCSDSPETDNRDSQVAAPATCMADQSGCKPDSDANSTAVEDVVDAERTKALRKSGRVALPLKLARVWSRVGTLSDSVLFQPADITADEKAIYLSDFSGGRIIALKMETGEVSWTFGRMGDGPGEFRGLSSFAAIRGDTITIWNRSLSRVTELSTSGHLIGTRQINAASRIFTLCVLKDGTLVSNRFMGVDSMMIATAAPTGDSLQLLMALPWKEIRGAPAIAAQFVLHSLGDGSCLLTPLYWSGAVRFADGRLADSLRIVETVPVPEAAKRKGRGEASSQRIFDKCCSTVSVHHYRCSADVRLHGHWIRRSDCIQEATS